MDKGAHFFRCDFQVHTPRDANWQGGPAVSDEERMQWAESLIAACRSKGLDAIAITDHHDLVSFPYARAAAAGEKDADGHPLPPEQRIVVFPGIELTLSDPCQALLIFDADISDADLDRVATVLGYVPSPPGDSKTAQTTSLKLSLEEAIARLDEQVALRRRFILLPNVTTGGHKTLLREGFSVKYRSMPCVGGYVDGPFDRKTGPGERRILDGGDKNYGNKALAVFQTSDCRSSKFDTLGEPSTWVKWSSPTAEALRQSCLARHSRVARAAPQLPRVFVTRVEISSSEFLGKRDLFLNRQFNALIGGRGTGKSTVLEYLRWALCDQGSGAPDGQAAPDYEKRTASLIEKTLASVGGMVSVFVSVNGVAHVVRRRTEKGGGLSLKVGDDPFRDTAEDEVRRLLPVDAFSQKELSSLGGRADEMRRFLARGIEGDLDAVDADLRDSADQLRAAHARLQNSRVLRAEERTLAGAEESLKQQIEKIKLSVSGLSESDAKLVASADLFREEVRVLEAWRSEMGTACRELERLRDVLAKMPSDVARLPELPDGDEFRTMRDALAREYEAMRSQVEAWVADLSAARGPEAAESATRFSAFREGSRKVEERVAAMQADYEKAKARMEVHATALKDLEELRAKLSERQRDLAERRQQLQELTAVESAFERVAGEWLAAVRRRGELLLEEASRLETRADGMVRTVVRPAAGFQELGQQLSDAIRGSRVRGDRIDAIVAEVCQADDPLFVWLEVLRELESLTLLKGRDGAPIPDLPRLRAAGFSDKDLRAVAEQMSSDMWLGLRVTPPRDEVQFQYRSREDEFIPFEDASAGQRATALLRILLKQEGPPLVIDQPEDDLDNEVIHAVARELWNAKAVRQLVFASHNANLVVNGDADLVVAFGYAIAGEQSSGEVKAEGAIDDEDVRKQIALVMEGGREAFELRRDKYGF
ncbi:MAG: AAA family ATPase [Planctomycetes bacterium]|nr:AAA family ATPase [Planctomycetota bacterium]